MIESLEMISNKIKAIIYDFDGTMVNSEPIHLDAWDKTLQDFSLKLTDLPLRISSTMSGKKPTKIADEVITYFNLNTTAQELVDKKTSFFMEKVQKNIALMPHLIKILKSQKENGYVLAIGSSGEKKYINLILDKFDLKKYFDVIITGDEARFGKPHPEIYLRAIKKLNVSPTQSVVIEDGITGVQAAKAAGCFCVYLSSANKEVEENQIKADRTISSLEEITTRLLNDLIK